LNNQTIIGLGIFVLLVLILYLLHSSSERREQNDLRKALIEKFGSAQDLGSFLQSEGGRRFIADLSSGTAGALGSVLASIQKGIILVLLGIGCAAANVFTSVVALGIGVVFLCVGVGFLVSAGVTYWLSRSWGLLGKRSDS
jgi:hypothetical protein